LYFISLNKIYMKKEVKKNIKVFISWMILMWILMWTWFSIFYWKIKEEFIKELRIANIPKIVYWENWYKYLQYRETNPSFLWNRSSFISFNYNQIWKNKDYFQIKNQVQLVFSWFESEKDEIKYSNKYSIEQELKKYTDTYFTILNINSQQKKYNKYWWIVDFNWEVPRQDLKNIKYLKEINNFYNKRRAGIGINPWP